MKEVVIWFERIGLGVLGVLILLMLFGAGYEAIARYRAAKEYPPTGKLVDIGGRKLHIDCRGAGGPTVVFEAGLDYLGAVSWASIHDKVATTTRACAYSRAGILWSDAADDAFDPQQAAKDLRAALRAAGERPPFVLVGHSLGGPYSMIFTGLFPAEVAGLVFVDASHPDQEARIDAATNQSPKEGAPFVTRLLSALPWTGLPRWLATGSGGDAVTNMPQLTKTIGNAYIGTGFGPMMRESDGLREIFRTAGRFRDLGDRPLVVLTGDRPASEAVLRLMGLTPDQGRRMQEEWRKLHEEQTAWSRQGRHEIIPDASHYIQFDRPDRVVAAIDSVVEAVRQTIPQPAPTRSGD